MQEDIFDEPSSTAKQIKLYKVPKQYLTANNTNFGRQLWDVSRKKERKWAKQVSLKTLCGADDLIANEPPRACSLYPWPLIPFPQLVRGCSGCVALCVCALLHFLVIFLGFGGELPRCAGGRGCPRLLLLAFPVCFFARSCAPRTQRAGTLRPHFVHHSASLMFLRGGWGCRPSLGCCSVVALHRSRKVCCVLAACGAGGSAIRRHRTRLKLLCVCSPVRSALTAAWAGHRMLARAAAAVASSALLRMAFVAIAACFDTAACAAYWTLC